MKLGEVSLVIISDITCPWCYIGQRELQKAVRDVADCGLTIRVEHRPFLLHPTMSEDEAHDKREWYEEKFGKEKRAQIQKMVQQRAANVGVEINWEGWVTQTIRAHRLSRKACEIGGGELQEKFLDAVFYAYFTAGKNINDVSTLGDLAEEVGVMTKEETIAFLNSEELQTEIEHMADEARKKGVSGVPFTIINGRWAVSGGQSSETYVQIFRKLAGAKGPLQPIPAAPTCGDSLGGCGLGKS